MLRRLLKLSGSFVTLAKYSLTKVFKVGRAKVAHIHYPLVRHGRFPGLLKTGRFPFRLSPQFWQQVRTASRVQFRSAGVIGSWARYGSQAGATFAFAGISLQAADSFRGSSLVFDRIRDIFDSKCKLRSGRDDFPTCLDGYDIGNFLGRGCNAAVYAAKIRQSVDVTEREVGPIREIVPSTSITQEPAENREFPLAIKMCFNTKGIFGHNVVSIVNYMGQELVPCVAPRVKKMLRRERALSRKHPNIVEINTAFVDQVRLSQSVSQMRTELTDCNLEAPGVTSTLFLVMKRYRTTLTQFILTELYNVRAAQVMYAQILEGVRFLVEEGVAHRDLKSNNILLEYAKSGDVPSVVISDFGCCLANQVLTLFYWDEFTDLGGNRALRPPEIACAKPGLTTLLNFSRTDLWAAATIGYEIFTRVNPFYRHLNSETYTKEDLPQMPNHVPYAVRKLTKRMLCRNPQTRPSPECCANVLALSLFDLGVFREIVGARKLPNYIRFAAGNFEFGAKTEKTVILAPSESGLTTVDEGLLHEATDPYIESPVDKLQSPSLWEALAEALCYYSAETMVGGACKTLSHPEVILRNGFLRRVDADAVVDAAEYFLI